MVNFILLGLPQDHQKAHGLRHHQEAFRVQLLLFGSRMYSGFQYNVHQLLRLQQTWRGCSRNGADSGETVSQSGMSFMFCTLLDREFKLN